MNIPLPKFARSLLILTLAIALSFLVWPQYQARAEAAWQILFNGKVSTAQLLDTDSGAVVNVSFHVPAVGEQQSYGVLLETDPDSKQVKITRVKTKSPLRERGDCPQCTGSKECQDCYPVGSGVGTSGEACLTCNGTGDCFYCSGSGLCYTCGGGGHTGGCFTCGDDITE